MSRLLRTGSTSRPLIRNALARAGSTDEVASALSGAGSTVSPLINSTGRPRLDRASKFGFAHSQIDNQPTTVHATHENPVATVGQIFCFHRKLGAVGTF